MKQMTLIEMDGFLKGKCTPRDLKVNETNAEYLVRKFGELESKLETALRECRSAGITIDNLEVKCAALLDELDKWKQESSAWQAVADKQLALAASAEQKIAELESLTAPKLPQPAPVSVPEVVDLEDVPEEITEDDIALASAWAHGFNQCRAAMLKSFGHSEQLDEVGSWNNHLNTPTAQTGNHAEQNLDMVDHFGDATKKAMLHGSEPVTTAYKSPDDFICMLTGRAKYLREKGEIKSPELLERAAAALQGESVNAPSIPNGWKLVPIDPTKDMLRAGQSVVGFWLNTVHCYSKMLAAAPAAPQQEVKE